MIEIEMPLLSTVDELLACLRAAPHERVVLATSEGAIHSYVRHGTHECAGVVPPGSPAAEMLEQAWDAAGHGSTEGGDQQLWERLPVRYGPWCSSWVLPEHPQARADWAANWATP